MNLRSGIVTCLICLAVLGAACSSAPQVSRIDLTEVSGVFVVVYSGRADVRRAMEDQLVADLATRGMTAHASHGDVPDIVGSTPQAVLGAAGARRVAAILVVDEVVPGTAGVVRNPARISPEHPDLQAFFAHVRAQAPEPVEPAREALAEANLFLLQGADARLFWSGVALTRAADGSGAGLRDLSAQIADALARAQREVRGG